MKQKYKIVMIHGSSGRTKIHDPNYVVPNRRHWHGWIEDELKKKGYKVYNPIMPNDWQPKYSEWKKVLEKIPVDKNTIIIGTSAGAPFVLKYLLDVKKKVKKIILNAPAYFLTSKGNRIK